MMWNVPMSFKSKSGLAAALIASAVLAGCASGGAGQGMGAQAGSSAAVSAQQNGQPDHKGGMRKVKGRGGWEGYISGQPWADAKFNSLEIGMSYRQVLNLIGLPTDEYSHITGKAFIPFYFGSGRHEHKLLYKGQGRLVLSGDAGFAMGSNAYLIGIEYNPDETGVAD